ncbi:fructokinase [Bacillus sp. F2HM]|uniref:ROK family protein n=1 Tax=Bacillus sp. F2HM TaxID=1784817 RepID=UPI001C4E01B6|nr:ROK family protein [Bacillus sp. F2HM]MBW0256897.1 fructokinase [Bacillus sp. F2HM]
MRIGGIEAGGTKFVCGYGTTDGTIEHMTSFATGNPDETCRQVIDYFTKNRVDAIGIGAFGPVDVKEQSPSYGTILDTPKTAWRQFPFLSTLKQALGIPMKLDTDVNCAALGEARFSTEAEKPASLVYITVGTGIGGGAYIEHRLIHGLLHPEMGHITVQRHPHDTYGGCCPIHHDCLEGLASGPAIEGRYHTLAPMLPEDHPAWSLHAYYLGQMTANLLLTLSPERIILGGGVMKQPAMLPLILDETDKRLHGYLQLPKPLHEIITKPSFDGLSGLMGAIALGTDALQAQGAAQ